MDKNLIKGRKEREMERRRGKKRKGMEKKERKGEERKGRGVGEMGNRKKNKMQYTWGMFSGHPISPGAENIF